MAYGDTSGRGGWRIGQVADAAGVTVRALHHYEQVGLLSPSQRSAGGHRLFSDDDVQRLYQIRVLRELGLSLAEIGPALAGSTGLDGALRAHLRQVQTQLERLTWLRDRLSAACDHLDPQPSADELLSMLDAMSVVAGRGEEWRESSSDAIEEAVDWRELGDELRMYLEAGDDPTTPRVLEVARRAQDGMALYSDNDPAVMEALAYLRRGSPRFDHAGWDLALMRYLNSALIALDEADERS